MWYGRKQIVLRLTLRITLHGNGRCLTDQDKDTSIGKVHYYEWDGKGQITSCQDIRNGKHEMPSMTDHLLNQTSRSLLATILGPCYLVIHNGMYKGNTRHRDRVWYLDLYRPPFPIGLRWWLDRTDIESQGVSIGSIPLCHNVLHQTHQSSIFQARVTKNHSQSAHLHFLHYISLNFQAQNFLA